MSDRIGVMRKGKLAQVGSPATIYTQPENRFVTEFMGEVNSLPVHLAGDGRLHCEALDASFEPPAEMPPGFSRGVLIVRPENVAISDDAAPSAGGNLVRGELFNEYLLGSRIQYQVRSGRDGLPDRGAACRRRRPDTGRGSVALVAVGRFDGLSGMTEAAADTPAVEPERPRRRIRPWKISEGFVAALPIMILLVIGFRRADGAGAGLQLHAARQLLRLRAAVAGELRRHRRAGLLHLLRLVALPRLHQRRDPADRLLSAGGGTQTDQGAPRPPADAAHRGAALRRREHPVAGLGALLRQGRVP